MTALAPKDTFKGGFCAHVTEQKFRVYCLWGWSWMVGDRVSEGREGDMNPRKLVLVVVWVVYSCMQLQ